MPSIDFETLVEEIRTATKQYDDAQQASSPQHDKLAALLEELREQPTWVRNNIIDRMGHDEQALRALSILVQYESDWGLRVRIVNALVAFGLRALDVLIFLTDDPSEEVCLRAIEGLGQVVLAAYPELQSQKSTSRCPGAPRVRGISAACPDEVERILSLLDKLRCQEWSEEVRRTADTTLGLLDG